MEDVIHKFVDIDDGQYVVEEDLVVLEGTEVASLCDGIDFLDHSHKSHSHLIVDRHVELGDQQLDAGVQGGDISNAHGGVW